ncbi:PREDICTED: uncharacterized protein LOC106745900, partial [Dinoponera quadriceps]|uniref:Uncharacterized protein LOC106745900 n=1 Tax=Dinoponera quadriceps TaxID=609295 RepID=A0A6P3XHC4_DINQU
MTYILNIEGEPIFDDRIVKIESHTYNPYDNTTLGYSDEIRIPMQQQDLYTLPCVSYLYAEGKIIAQATAENVAVTLENNCVAFMFDEIRYELDGVEIDHNRNVRITSTVKNYVSLSSYKIVGMKNAAWDTINAHSTDGYFNFCVPFSMLLGFCEDCRRIVINARHELILIRSRSDNNGLRGSLTLEPK